jgi:solute carrier family 25 phosphate transporter 23/24/25/41
MAEIAAEILYATSPQPAKLTTLQSLGAGFVAGTLARTITSPLDVIKMMMQVSAKGGSAKATIDKLWKEDGVAGFWRGNFAACIRLGPQSALKFYAFDQLNKIFGKGKPLSGFQRTVAGSMSGVISQSITYPLDVIRTRITVDPKKYTGIFQAMLKITSEEGIGSLFSGIGVSILGVIPYEGAQFYAYGGLRNIYTTKIAPGKPVTPWANCLIGASAGMFSQTFSYPFDLVRKRLMLRDKEGKPLYNGMIDAVQTILKNEGLFGLYKGVSFNLIKVVPFAALQFTLLDETKKMFIKYNQTNAKCAASCPSKSDPKKVQRKK